MVYWKKWTPTHQISSIQSSHSKINSKVSLYNSYPQHITQKSKYIYIYKEKGKFINSSCTLQTVAPDIAPDLGWDTHYPSHHTYHGMKKIHKLTHPLHSQSPLSLVHSWQVGWSFPSPWRVGYDDAYNRDDVHALHSLMGWSHNHHGCIWNKAYGMMYHQLPPEKAMVSAKLLKKQKAWCKLLIVLTF